MKQTTVVRAALAAAGALVLGTALWWGPFAAHHLLPLEWTGEAERLADRLGVERGASVAEIGAGAGAMAMAMTRRVGETGRVYATELSASRRAEIAAAVEREGVENVVVVAAEVDDSGLAPECCDAIYMRQVFHHVEGPERMARQLRAALREGGRLGVIDFPPGHLSWHLGPDHGAPARGAIDVFSAAGFRLRDHEPEWGGGTYLLVFEAGPGAVNRPRSPDGASPGS